MEKRMIRLLCYLIPFSAMNIAMFNVALPTISAEYGTGLGATSWTITVFGIIYAIGALLYGKIADIYGVKKLVVFGIVVFSAGSLAGLLAHDFGTLLVGRILQAIGASSIPSLSLLIPARYIPQERRGRALGLIAATLAIAGAAGPIVGGLIIGWIHWRYLFLFSLGVIFALPFVRKSFPAENIRAGESVNLRGAALFVVAIVSLMLAVTLFNVWLLLAGICCLVVFLVRERRAVSPFIPFSLLHLRAYRHGLYMGALNAAINFGVLVMTPLLFSQVYGLDAHWIGLLMFPGAFAASMLGYHGGKLIDRRGNGFVLARAIVLIGLGLLALSSLAGHAAWGVAGCLLLANAGYIGMQSALANWVSGMLPEERKGVGMGLYSLSNFLSTSLCGAVVTTLLDMIGSVPLNPIATAGEAGRYSNVYLGLFALSAFNMLFIHRFALRAESARMGRQ